MPTNTPSSHDPIFGAVNKDESLFDLFGDYVFGDLEVTGLSERLDDLELPPAQRTSWSNFLQNYSEEYQDHLKGRGSAPSFDALPKVKDDSVRRQWNSLAKAPSQDTHTSLVAQRASQKSSQPGPASSQDSAASANPKLFKPGTHPPTFSGLDSFFGNPQPQKRVSKPPKRITSDYEYDGTDAEGASLRPRPKKLPARGRTVTSNADGGAKGAAISKDKGKKRLISPERVDHSAPSSKKPRPPNTREAREFRAAAQGRDDNSDLSSEDDSLFDLSTHKHRKYDDNDEDDSQEDVFQSPKGSPDDHDDDSDEDGAVEAAVGRLAKDMPRPGSKKVKTGKKSKKARRASNTAPDKKAPARASSSSAKRHSRRQQDDEESSADGSDDDEDPDNVDDIEDLEVPPKMSTRKGLGSRGSIHVPCFKPIQTYPSTRFDNKAKVTEKFTVTVYKCSFCASVVKVPKNEVSRLALHFNPNGTVCCKRRLTPIDLDWSGHHGPDPRGHPVGSKANPEATGALKRYGAAAYSAALGKDTTHGAKAPGVASAAGTSIAGNSSIGVGDDAVVLRNGAQQINQWRHKGYVEAHRMLTAIVRKRAIIWLIVEALPFITVTKPTFIHVIESISPAAVASFVSARQVQRDVHALSMVLFDQAVSVLQTVKFSIQVDEWTSPGQQHAFHALVVNFIDRDWTYHSHLIDFQVMQGRHTGASYAGHVVSFLRNNNLLENWTGVMTTDSVSANVRMGGLIDDKLAAEGLPAKNVSGESGNHVRCFAHHLNLVVKALYVALGVPVADTDPRSLKTVEPVDVGPEEVEAQPNPDDIPMGEWSDEETDPKKLKDVRERRRRREQRQAKEDAFFEGLEDNIDGEVLLEDMESTAKTLPTITEEEDDPALSSGAHRDADVQPSGAGWSADAATQSTANESQTAGQFDGRPGDGSGVAASAGDLSNAQGQPASPARPQANSQGSDDDPAPSSAQSYMSPLVRIAEIVRIARAGADRRRRFLRKAREAYPAGSPKAKELFIPPAYNHTRWNSRFFQLHAALRFAKGIVYVVRADDTGDYGVELNIKPEEIKLLRKVCDILAFITKLTKASERREPTAADVLRYHAMLKGAIEFEMNEARRQGGEAGNYFADALEVAAEKLAGYRTRALRSETLLMAAALHPAYMLNNLRTTYGDEVAKQAKDLLKRELEKENGGTLPPVVVPMPSPSVEGFKAQWGAATASLPQQSKTSDELTSYLNCDFPHVNGQKALDWWRQHSEHFPKLSTVARRILGASGSTAEVERVFSAAGRVLSPRRRKMSPHTLQQLIIAQQLMKANYDPMGGPDLEDVPASAAAEPAVPAP